MRYITAGDAHLNKYIRKRGFICSADLFIDGKRLKFIFWKDKQSFNRAVKRSFDACFFPVYNSENDWGFLHFYLDGIGSGIVAHELYHWIHHVRDTTDFDEEKMAEMVQITTIFFWNYFYKNFEREEE